MGALPTRDELFDVVLKGKQLEQTMKDRQAGGGAKSGPPAPVPVPAPAPAAPDASPPPPDASPPARDASLPACDATPAVAARLQRASAVRAVADDDSDDEFLAFNSGMGVRTSPQADRLDEFMAADAGYTTADDERDAAGLAAETLAEPSAALV
ncbi:hypothetical protein SO694_00002043 [Aureococcus anophagefferens]|uniref:Uncharacterized protein n=1 Tax=Aureococcus anophagefferens TaxID=44056 RepID=A0ABR1GCM2_AURAN